MKYALTFIATVTGTLVTSDLRAQENCRPATRSCTEMHATCARICRDGNNPDACIARTCSAALPVCQSTGVWSVRGSATCWKTSNRS